MGKALLFDTESDWRELVTDLNGRLGLPSGATASYASTPKTVANESSEDFGKYVLSIKEIGTWKCDQFFEPDELVEWNPAWFDLE